jgi:hypothetical protein
VTFTIKSTKIVADGSTGYRNGDCGKVRNGRGVTVTGTVQADQSVRATRIDIDQNNDD